ncbi:hypothetical protein LAZ67_14001910 [Cordylochernes scorpioides]|uniref:Uncharacterized protein n=1 Tax=Cordylochernes scorpioides TaxID=51811 RepID=A0ABY6L795_9ARAC|nr:hypothetical protein LAZ67_14001910 [Cordylochernes scorpioides]
MLKMGAKTSNTRNDANLERDLFRPHGDFFWRIFSDCLRRKTQIKFHQDNARLHTAYRSGEYRRVWEDFTLRTALTWYPQTPILGRLNSFNVISISLAEIFDYIILEL